VVTGRRGARLLYSRPTPMRILLLGGTGFIGSLVVEHLLLTGHEVAVVHRGHRPVPPGSASLIADRGEPGPLSAALETFHPEALIDMIAYTAADADRVLAVLPAHLRRLTVVSSGDVYASYGAFLGHEPPPQSSDPSPETGALRRGRFPYRAQATSPADVRHGYDKILVEERYRDRSPVPVTILRLPMVHGPRDPHHRVAPDIARLQDAPGGVLELHPEEAAWRCTRGYVVDVAAAIALATTHPDALGQTYNVGEVDAWTTREWLEVIAQSIESPTIVRESSTAVPSLSANWTTSVLIATDQIRKELGYVEPIGRTEGVRRSARAVSAPGDR
jgi:nucleoside-diphosphate-sugar epimerase